MIRQRSGPLTPETIPETGRAGARLQRASTAVTVVAALTALALVVRLIGLGEPSLSHPEIYVPGIELPPGISEPPPRYDFLSALWWHFHDEPHPMGWYLAMFGWTQLAGTSEFALRLPGAILGAASVPLVFLLGRRVFSPGVGLVAAMLLAFHGFHVFWSQNARMYVAGAFLGILATDLLLRLAAERRARPLLEAGYVATCLAGVLTVELFWPFLLMQVAWVSLSVAQPQKLGRGVLLRPHRAGPRLLQVQALTMMLGAPAILHAAYRARHAPVASPSLEYLTDYAQFGFLMTTDRLSFPTLSLPAALYWAVLAVAVVLVLLSTRTPVKDRRPAASDGGPGPLPGWILPAVSVAVALFMLWLASTALRRTEALMAMSILPFMAVGAPLLGVLVRTLVARVGPLDRALGRVPAAVLLLWCIGVLAPLLLWVASFLVSVLAERAFLVFVPALLVLVAGGVFALPRTGLLRAGAVAVLAAIVASSLVYNNQRRQSPNDYKGLAEAMRPLWKAEDLIFVGHRAWADTPFLHYLPEGRYVTQDYAEALTANPEARVWLVTWPNEVVPVIEDERRDALAVREPSETVTAFRASAELFLPEF